MSKLPWALQARPFFLVLGQAPVFLLLFHLFLLSIVCIWMPTHLVFLCAVTGHTVATRRSSLTPMLILVKFSVGPRAMCVSNIA